MESKIIIHGGFFSESIANQEVKTAKQKALAEIVTKSYEYLQDHTAFETALFAVTHLEDCDLFNAGLGSQIQSDGKIRLSASVMDGKTEKFAGVINIENVKNAVQVAASLISQDDRVLSGSGALEYARQNGFDYFNPETPQRRKEYTEKLNASIGLGTVGCVALDKAGNIAAATSTGGKGFEIPGRVSDSATVAGNFANSHAGVSCTGVGEDIVSAGLSVKIVTRVSDGMTLAEACRKSFDELKPYDGFAGIIGISSTGEIHHTDSHPYMVWAAYDKDLSIFE
jgi:L-asparaginase